MLDLNVTLVFQLANFFIAVYVLNILLIRPIRAIIKKRNGILEGMEEEAGSFEYQASERLTNYEAELTRARQDAGLQREEGRAAGVTEQQQIVGEAQKGARDILTETRAALEAQAAATLAELRGKVDGLSARLADRLLKG
ncbi:ATP synthase F0 subunit B [Desulfovibrio legallii]|jgi:F-type H+-transporting ATPase subunit b|uniref:ATP synthase subunit b n=1 Tax=Desulfovibrio legallii TaxID=571438 RepID=A0A6H3FEN0_9BACT|nr:ATP synthase F0 subunit B [Desulfovibrio legallii]RHH24101.1 ATPase [Desulfovibrio sp. AM18-2]TBH81553.1 ATPase [Desulfovibrio legallii]